MSNTPELKKKDYSVFKNELQAWQEFTTILKEKQQLAVALLLDQESDIREKVFSELSTSDLKCVNGLNNLITFLDSILLIFVAER